MCDTLAVGDVMIEGFGRGDGELWPGLLYLGEWKSGGDIVRLPLPPSTARVGSVVTQLALWAGANSISVGLADRPSLPSGGYALAAQAARAW